MIEQFLNDESGATLIEYGFVLSLVSISVITAMSAAGTEITGFFTDVSADLERITSDI